VSGPFILISTWGIKDGKVEELKRFQEELSELIQAKEPQLIAFNAFLNEEGTEMTSIQVHPDTASMDFHLQVLSDHLGDAMSSVAPFVEPRSLVYYGMPPESLRSSITSRGENPGSKPIHMGGFTRLPGA
jgi:hypothetical protein